MVLLLGHRQEGLSLARMAGFSQGGDNRIINVICNTLASFPETDTKSVTRMGAELIEKGAFDGGGLMKLLENHLLPTEQILPNESGRSEPARQI